MNIQHIPLKILYLAVLQLDFIPWFLSGFWSDVQQNLACTQDLHKQEDSTNGRVLIIYLSRRVLSQLAWKQIANFLF